MKETTLSIDFGTPREAETTMTKHTDHVKLKPIPREEVRSKTLEFFNGDELATDVWINKYALKDYEGNIYESSPVDMHWRIATEISRVEAKYKNPLSKEEIFNLIKDFKYIIPQGSPMAGIGNNFQHVSLSNCFVIGNPPNSDSYGGIMKIDEEQVQLMKRRGGVGHDLSAIRPLGSSVKNSALTSTGVVSFMERYSNSTREVAQDGRRGALMLSLSVKHPDVLEFITAKTDTSKITGANISVRIDDEFMRAVINDGDYQLQYPVDSPNPKFTTMVKAKEIWDIIINSAWSSAEPGILFWDTVLRESVPDSYADYGFKTISTNPCGEIPLCAYDSCRLLALNLYSYVDNPFTPSATFNFPLFKKHVAHAQRIMDDIVDLELEKIDAILKKIEKDPEAENLKKTELNLWRKIKNKSIEGRRVGIGITGEGDMLAAVGLRYGSDEAIAFSENIHKNLALEAYRSSVNLAKERQPFPLYSPEKEKNNPFINRLKEADEELYKEMTQYGRRNIALLTIAPTGTVSLMTQTTSGIEPVFRISYTRRRKINSGEQASHSDFTDTLGDKWVETRVFHHAFNTYLSTSGYNQDEIRNKNAEELNAIIADSPYYQSTSADIDWIQKVKMQGIIQKWVDHSISVTVNLPEDTDKNTISEIYKTAWSSGCKGITIYREGSRTGVLVSDDKAEKKEALIETKPPKRPRVLDAKILRFMNNHEKWIAIVGLLDQKPYEIFTGKLEDSFAILATVDVGWVIKNKIDGDKT
ncbi:MAG: adenosylcobalamin-dependent ribonucleoside-diphosphate reductase, partial [Cyclobacteriaceae bacterium]|nr:adenosylcobalamin-dependent ribonucleoside-diphosphate reductase [Cyclobacteriaceae bacterium]